MHNIKSLCGRGPWPSHCGLERFVLFDRPFPGPSARLPLQFRRRPRGGRATPLSLFAALDQPPSAALHGDPGVAWVELEEELLDGGLREESGLCLPHGQFSWPRWGSLLLVSPEYQPQLQARIQPDPQKVSAIVWLEPDVAAAVAATEDGTETASCLPEDLPPYHAGNTHPPPVVGGRLNHLKFVSSNVQSRQKVLQSSAIELADGEPRTSGPAHDHPATAEDRERVSTATKFALGLWLQYLDRCKRSSYEPRDSKGRRQHGNV
ncbi:PREDICTED: nucleoside diphosphate-linked moiety X motif 17 [Dipodomys ordii]|uniref:Nucleoside diphosphate-linked moiety X motif 17 n=1 Tax=Dipodomys ordii TaxID=10020 RepID=A0A1S3FAV2_DIPOR|nr:PREDICTED: nucleoside diphosphate-linked moiety X motif 17 [Dipodomys ordii]